MKRSAGFTLIEMLITIAVASTITLAASGALLHVFQTQRIGFEESKRQNAFRITHDFIETALERKSLTNIHFAEHKNLVDTANYKGDAALSSDDEKAGWSIVTEPDSRWDLESSDSVLLGYEDGSLTAGGAEIATGLSNVVLKTKNAASGTGMLISIQYETETSNGPYTTTYYYRTARLDDGLQAEAKQQTSSLQMASERARQLNSSAAVVRAAVPFSTTGSVVAEKQAAALLEETRNAVGAEARLQFLEALWSQYGSTGMILDAAHQPTDQSFASWYDGTWPDSTPWCACYLSWALYRARGGIEGTPLRFASIKNGIELLSREDGAFGHFYTGFETARYASPGDILFFDWEGDGDPDHVGAVLTRGSDVVYTVEGNSAHAVALREYKLDDPHICGLGTIPWREDED